MKKLLFRLGIPGLILFIVLIATARQVQQGYVVENEKNIGQDQPGPHDGGGKTTAFPFFSKVKDTKLVFRKRVLHPGSSIGYHLQKVDEIYYVLSGKGEMQMNGSSFPVQTGDAVLTRPGSSHGLKPVGNDDLTIFIIYKDE